MSDNPSNPASPHKTPRLPGRNDCSLERELESRPPAGDGESRLQAWELLFPEALPRAHLHWGWPQEKHGRLTEGRPDAQ